MKVRPCKMASTALATMKFLVDLIPNTGTSSCVGTRGRRDSGFLVRSVGFKDSLAELRRGEAAPVWCGD